MTCSCGGRLSRPTLGRRTGLWIQTCVTCWQATSGPERPDYDPPAPRPAYTPKVKPDAMTGPRMVAIAELVRANALDGKLRQTGE